MSVDFKVVADAVATRFDSANITAPTGATNIQLSTASLPGAIAQEPTILVFPPEVDLAFGPSLRKGFLEFPIRFYIYRVRDNPRNAELILNWMTALYDQLPDTLAHLGLSTYVNTSQVRRMAPGELIYGGESYHGIEITVEVNVSEGMNVNA